MHDRARIHVKAGGGGNGCLSFRREAHVPKGGPDGGDGARGGDIVLICDDNLRDLERFRRSLHFKAKRGGHGRTSVDLLLATIHDLLHALLCGSLMGRDDGVTEHPALIVRE